MSSTRLQSLRLVITSLSGVLLALVLSTLLASQPAVAAEALIPRPAALERDVQFWIRVYTEVTTNEGFVHDMDHLGVVYETLRFTPDTPPKEREKTIESVRDRHAASLRRIAAANLPPRQRSDATDVAGTAAGLTADELRIREMWGSEGTPQRLLAAIEGMRFQLGQADRFRAGIIRSGAYEAHIAQQLANRGLPPEIAALPHVESSFNPAAYSKVGAAGLWQFMRETGRRYMRIDSAVDERLDPYRASEAAAQLHAYNYRILGSWPLALTAYNHGAGGMRRARDALGTDDIAVIVRQYKGRTFGFASRNFYVSFLAALTIDQNPEKYFGPIERAPEQRFHEVALPAYVTAAALQRTLAIDRETLRGLNPALLETVWNGQRLVPRGYQLRLPVTANTWTTALLAERLSATEQFVAQIEPRSHRVRKGETLERVATKYGLSTRTLANLNGLSTESRVRPGRWLRLPDRQPALVASAAAKAAPATAVVAETGDAPTVYVVRRGEALSDIAARTRLTESQLMSFNRLRDPNFIFEGQRLRLSAPPPEPERGERAEPTVAAAATTMAPTTAPATSIPVAAQAAAPGAAPSSGPTTRATPVRGKPVAQSTPAVVPASAPAAAPIAVAAVDSQRRGAIVRSGEVTTEPLVRGSSSGPPVRRVGTAGRNVTGASVRIAAVSPVAPASQPLSGAQADALGPSLVPGADSGASTDPVDYSIGAGDTIRVAAAETLGHYADWSGVGASRLRQLNDLRSGKPVLLGQTVKLDLRRTTADAFEQKRREYHAKLQADFFDSHRILGTEVYIARRGDSLWAVTQRYSGLPAWLLQQYNPDVDLGDLRPGTQIVVPCIEQIEAAGG